MATKAQKYANKKKRIEIYWKSLLPSERIQKLEEVGYEVSKTKITIAVKEKVYDNEPMHQNND